jgi:hypothetical protein
MGDSINRSHNMPQLSYNSLYCIDYTLSAYASISMDSAVSSGGSWSRVARGSSPEWGIFILATSQRRRLGFPSCAEADEGSFWVDLSSFARWEIECALWDLAKDEDRGEGSFYRRWKRRRSSARALPDRAGAFPRWAKRRPKIIEVIYLVIVII